MKWIIFLSISLVFSSFAFTKDPVVKHSIEVNGNCNMCKKTIEKAAKIEGVKKAKWDVKSHQLELEINPDKVTLDQIQLRIAAEGYDTPLYKSNDATYNKLHHCCQYPRKN